MRSSGMLLSAFACLVYSENIVSANFAAPLPFPPCRASDLACLRRGLRTFFFLMDERHTGMTPVDPTIAQSVALAYPDIGLRFTMRNSNITGARWTHLVDRKINNTAQRNTAIFTSNFHVTSTLLINLPVRQEPYHTYIVMDIREVQSSISYPWQLWRGEDGETYVVIGEEEITVARPQGISFYLEANNDEPLLRNALENRSSISEHLAKEITFIVVQNIVNNFKTFANNVPYRFYYKVWKP